MELPESNEAVIDRFRAALEQQGSGTVGWWQVQLDLCLIGVMATFGWEKALGEEGELAWQEATAAAAELIALGLHPLADHTVLDAGAGTGAATWGRGRYPRAAAGRPIRRRPRRRVRANRLTDPSAGLAGPARVTRPGGAMLDAVSSTTSSDPARDRIDTVAQDAGWQIPAWYTQLKTAAVPILGIAAAMPTTARPAGSPSGRPAADRRPLAGDNVA